MLLMFLIVYNMFVSFFLQNVLYIKCLINNKVLKQNNCSMACFVAI